MSNERKMIYLCLAHMSDEGLEQKYIKEAFDLMLAPEDIMACTSYNAGKEILANNGIEL